jgi:hypothetical protein
MWSKRDEIDYSLDRRATLEGLRKGLASAFDAKNIDPYLKRAAQHHGEETTRDCPVCKSKKLRELRYVFGDQLGQYSGRIKSLKELDEMENEFGEFRVYTVEVCLGCDWSHLVYSFILGDGKVRKPPRRQPTLEDEDFTPDKKEKKVKSWQLHVEKLREMKGR